VVVVVVVVIVVVTVLAVVVVVTVITVVVVTAVVVVAVVDLLNPPTCFQVFFPRHCIFKTECTIVLKQTYLGDLTCKLETRFKPYNLIHGCNCLHTLQIICQIIFLLYSDLLNGTFTMSLLLQLSKEPQ